MGYTVEEQDPKESYFLLYELMNCLEKQVAKQGIFLEDFLEESNSEVYPEQVTK